MNILYVGLAGFLGAIARVGLGKILLEINSKTIFPYPTLLINLVGSFLLAYFLISIDIKGIRISPQLKLAISTGFLGSFTTFSTFSVETLHLLQLQTYGLAFLYILLSFVGGFLFSWLGMNLAIRGSES